MKKIADEIALWLQTFSEIIRFIRRGNWLIGLMMFLLLAFGLFVVLTQGSALAPFIYTLF